MTYLLSVIVYGLYITALIFILKKGVVDNAFSQALSQCVGLGIVYGVIQMAIILITNSTDIIQSIPSLLIMIVTYSYFVILNNSANG